MNFFTPRDPVQIEWDATSWIYNQLNKRAKDKKRPDINFHIKSGNTFAEIGCGEVKKDKTGAVEAKARVLKVMKRQLHLRMKLAKKMNEAETFGILVIGTEITLFRMNMDTTKWVYVYEESSPFQMPTTYATYDKMDVSMSIMLGFKHRIEQSLVEVDGDQNGSVWEVYQPHVQPTVASFETLYHTE